MVCMDQGLGPFTLYFYFSMLYPLYPTRLRQRTFQARMDEVVACRSFLRLYAHILASCMGVFRAHPQEELLATQQHQMHAEPNSRSQALKVKEN
jgi:hypothetical protein